MLKLTFEINGRKVDPNNMADALEAAMLSAVRGNIEQRLSTVRCPVHGSAPTVTCKGSSLERLSFSVSGCCNELIETTKRALK
jgi:hypothetical protein